MSGEALRSPAWPQIMGVLNVTPDSFSDGDPNLTSTVAIQRGLALAAAGAGIVDIGGESTRPGAGRISPELERSRALPVIEGLSRALGAAGHSGTRLSIDTMNASTAEAALSAGAKIINDVSGGMVDPAIFAVAAAHPRSTLVLGHWRAPSAIMNEHAKYRDVVSEVAAELQSRVDAALAAGVARGQLVLDPGLGFAKDAQHNWQLLARLGDLAALGYPVMIGASRKRFIAEALPAGGSDMAARDGATAVLTALLATAPASAPGRAPLWAVRVHNVSATRDALAVAAALAQ